MSFRFAVISLMCFVAVPVFAKDYAYVIGGGPYPSSSQVQIENNIKWVSGVIKGLPDNRQVQIYFTDGGAAGKDVKATVLPHESNDSLQPLARVFGSEENNSVTYHDSQIEGLTGGTEAEHLKKALQESFKTLTPDDRVFIYYNGHGLPFSAHQEHVGLLDKLLFYDAGEHFIRLWKDTSITAREMEQSLSQINPRVPVRFVFTQCFSGGFARLITPHADGGLKLSAADRCGFLSVADNTESEGCTTSIDTADYRDYTSYFMAALSGKTIQGSPISDSADLNGDGSVSLYEAHLYTLKSAVSTDIPRSTSEVYLEQWQPWYLRWLTFATAQPANVYSNLAIAVAKQNNLLDGNIINLKELRAQKNLDEAQLQAYEKEANSLEGEIANIQNTMQNELTMRWPEISQPYTLNYYTFLTAEVSAAENFITKHKSYPTLVAKQERLIEIDKDSLALKRHSSQLEKIVRLRMLARTLDFFYRYASDGEKLSYERLLACENQPL